MCQEWNIKEKQFIFYVFKTIVRSKICIKEELKNLKLKEDEFNASEDTGSGFRKKKKIKPAFNNINKI
jgi:hypothetical protein